MALSCNPADIVKAAACFKCIPPNSAPLVKAYLLCQTAKIADPTSPCNTPSAPTALQVLNTSNTTIKVGWKQIKNTGSFITGYKVFWGTTSGGPYTSNSGVLPTLPRNYTITGLSVGTTYFIVVVALSAVPGCQSANSNEVSGTTTGAVPNGLLNSLVHFYQFQDAAAPFADSGSSPNALSITNGGATFARTTGHVQAFAGSYDGTGPINAVSTIVGAPFNYTGDGTGNLSMTWAFWMQLLGASGAQPATSTLVSVWTPVFIFYWLNTNVIRLQMQNAAAVTFNNDLAFVYDNNWHLIVGGFDFTNGRTFLSIDNGAIQTVAMANMRSVNSNAFNVGNCSVCGGNGPHWAFSDVAVWNGRALVASDINFLWNGGAGLPFSKFTV